MSIFNRRSTLVTAAAAVLVILIGVWAVGVFVRQTAARELQADAASTLAVDSALLDSELQRHRSTPVILATEAPLRSLLARPTEADRAVVNARLEALAVQTGAAAIYVIDRNGLALAASNYRAATSFVGVDYAFRPYFREAMADGGSEYFGLGTVSREPGLYISRRIDGPDGPLGVVVAKVQFDRVERAWRRQAGEVVVADARGVILLAGRTERRFTTLQPLSEAERRVIAVTRQFGDAPLAWSGARQTGPDRIQADDRSLLVSTARIDPPGWRLQVWTPTRPVEVAVVTARFITALALGLAALIAIWIWRSLRRSRTLVEVEAETRRVMERRVDERTRDLTQANEKLSAEVAERRAAETRLRRLQADLVQANRLAMLGQTMAGVAHEINQPVAAIRANADNALVLMQQGDEAEVRANLGRIQNLTERIGAVVEGLRGMARKGPRTTEPVQVDEAIEGAILLLNSRDRGGLVKVSGPTEGLRVVADRVRLEQVLINLLQNAFEAVEPGVTPDVALDVEATDDRVRIRVSDNGPGVAPALRDVLFTPFSTGKSEGLGLGLVISRDIVVGFGGTLELEPSDGGACFVVDLGRAA